MTPKQFLDNLGKGEAQPIYLFLGSELFFRDRCRRALTSAVLGQLDTEAGNYEDLTEVDLRDQNLTTLIDEARTMSLFASARLLIGSRSEALIPRTISTKTVASFEEK